MNTINQFFRVQHAVAQYKDARFFTTNHYEKKLETALTMTICMMGFASLISSFIFMSTTFLIWGMGLGIALFLYSQFSNSSLFKFIRKSIVSLIWGSLIEQKVYTIKSNARFQLYELKNVIQDMAYNVKEWRNSANTARDIMEFRA